MTSLETLRKIFKSSFDYATYSNEIVHRHFGCNDIATSPEQLPSSSDGDQNYFIGRMADADSRELGFFYTRVAEGSDVRRKRVGLRKLIAPYLKYEVDAAIAVFDDGNHWRLSYICDMKEGVTAAKRFSYILGDPQGQYKTPLERLSTLGTQASSLRLSDIRNAFSVDALSKEFFDEYHRHYDAICDYMVKHVEEFSIFNSQLSILHDYVKKMLGRIVFLHFLQKKGWLNGNQYFLRDLYFMSPYQADFLEQVLEPLFFGIFNTEPGNREHVFRDNGWDVNLLHQWNGENTQNSDFKIQNSPLPYLNGGLFERDKVDELNIKLPASLFEDLFTFLASYNFTVDENDPDDAEVGVDPEMLGKIFESLLEDNKAKGAFYTPKEIVRYMCKESLIAYLSSRVSELPCPAGRNLVNLVDSADASNCERSKANNNLQDSQDFASEASRSIRRFVEHHEMQPELEPYRDTLDSALRNVKICDPAIGSGAFPMGLLNELWRCREALYTPSPAGRDLVNLINSSDLVGNDNRVSLTANGGNNLQDLQDFASSASRSMLKKEIIENNIYGVDIERGAIDIARLRFWLSIVVDAEEPEPLPNFDYKFMQGNSLIESYKGIDLSRISNRLRGGQSKSTQLLLGLDSDFSKKNLQRLMRDYFSVTDHKQKASMRQAINDEVKRLITDFIGGTAADLDTLDPSANQDFFLWHTWFKDIFDNGGFDIVIGNPPYVYIDKEIFKKMYERAYHYQEGKIDLYRLFIEKTIGLTNSEGVISLITPNTFLSIKNCTKLRRLLLDSGSFLFIDNYDDSVFAASVNSVSFLFQKNNKRSSIIVKLHSLIKTKNINIDVKQIKRTSYLEININADENAITIKNKMLSHSVLFGEVKGVEMSLGVQPYHNTIHTPEQIKSEFLHSDHQLNDNYVKAYGGKHFTKYIVDKTPKRWIDYSAELYNKPDDRFFRGPRIVIRQIVSDTMVCAYVDEFALFNNSVLTIINNSETISVKTLLAVLNSKAVGYYISTFGDKSNQALFPRVSMKMLKQIPIPKTSLLQQKKLDLLVEEVISQKKDNNDTSLLEHQIDKLVYQLYNLNPEEIAIIEQ